MTPSIAAWVALIAAGVVGVVLFAASVAHSALARRAGAAETEPVEGVLADVAEVREHVPGECWCESNHETAQAASTASMDSIWRAS